MHSHRPAHVYDLGARNTDRCNVKTDGSKLYWARSRDQSHEKRDGWWPASRVISDRDEDAKFYCPDIWKLYVYCLLNIIRGFSILRMCSNGVYVICSCDHASNFSHKRSIQHAVFSCNKNNFSVRYTPVPQFCHLHIHPPLPPSIPPGPPSSVVTFTFPKGPSAGLTNCPPTPLSSS